MGYRKAIQYLRSLPKSRKGFRQDKFYNEYASEYPCCAVGELLQLEKGDWELVRWYRWRREELDGDYVAFPPQYNERIRELDISPRELFLLSEENEKDDEDADPEDRFRRILDWMIEQTPEEP